METSQEHEVEFYQELGQLFYAVAAADKVVRKSEFETLKTLVLETWIPQGPKVTTYGAPAEFQIEIVFDWLDDQQLDSNACFDSFAAFYKNNKSLFTQDRKVLILKTAHKIAQAFAGKNKSELILLAKLSLLFTDNS